MPVCIDAVRVVATETAQGEDSTFVALRAAGTTGWYGPVTAEIGRYVEAILAHTALGKPVDDHRGLHAALRRATRADTGTVASWAVGAVDCAAWDLHSLLVQVPVAHLLGATLQRRVPLYASWLGLDVAGRAPNEAVERVSRDGWQFTKWGLRRNPAAEDRATEAIRLAAAVKAVAATLVQEAAFDAVFSWDPAFTSLFLDRLDPASVRWLEDPLPECDLGIYRVLAMRAPLAVGERLLLHADAQAVLNVRLRAFTLDVVACGGLTRAVELVTTARRLGVPVYPHGRSFVPAVHLAASYPDAVAAVEYRLQWEPIRQQRYAQPWLPTRGEIIVPNSPGLGATPRSC
ncbi:enolase C-terminal domain-like protein [Micromonospora sp. WMMD1082]|uniref:mandelate racemase/muconate lactonizing enzyme family protein n=1 Tax=Micromonospora sp. WMMD1082 TaxID=3016104 RepID=UPI00241628CE|nr:enolase C-terminal domain-like protein [Micromonospora sp. WMMD1082]MDG4793483.1 enolase C-terminal domain-like protein [Micromonospora sp. WMMD1082]